jgi:hypothetical protein
MNFQKEHRNLGALIRRDPQTGCLTWLGSVDGYGRPIASNFTGLIGLASRAGVVQRPQHILFQRVFGYRAKQIELSCGNVRCLEPNHFIDKAKAKEAARKSAAILEETKTKLQKEEKIKMLEITINQLKAQGDKESLEYLETATVELTRLKAELASTSPNS